MLGLILLLCFGFTLSAPLSLDVLTSHGLKVRNISFQSVNLNKPVRVVFIHAAVGVFTYTRKDRLGQQWGFGADILEEIVDEVLKNRKLVISLDWIYVGLLGAESDLEETKERLSLKYRTNVAQEDAYSSRQVAKRKIARKKIRVVLEGTNKFMWEFPTLSLIQTYASKIHPESEILYLHTKGVRRNAPNDDTITQWRRYMLYWLVERHEICQHVLARGAKTCGANKRGGGKACYGGNFWWAKAGYLAQKSPKVAEIDWSINRSEGARYGAEEWLLKGEGPEAHTSKHYCVHHVHQDMRFCEIPRKWYALEELGREYVYRKDGNCFNIGKLPANSTRDTSTWCHKDGFPEID